MSKTGLVLCNTEDFLTELICSVMRMVIYQLFILAGIAILTSARLWYLKTHPIKKDVTHAIIPLLRHLHAADFFRSPRSAEVRSAFWEVHYGALWYYINLPLIHLTSFDARSYNYLLALLDVPFIWISFQFHLVGGLLYMAVGTFFLFRAPWNMSIMWLIICSIFSWVFLILAPVAKLPILTPTNVWGHVRIAMTYYHNPYYYGLLGILWLFVGWRVLLPTLFSGIWIGQIATFL